MTDDTIYPQRDVYPQSAVIPWRRNDAGDVEVLLITSRSGKRWVIPKGLIDPGESPPESAAREAEEEAGVRGDVGRDIVGHYSYKKWGGVCEVDVYLLHVTNVDDHWLEDDFRERKWMSPDDAAELVREDELAETLRSLDGLH